VAGGTSSQTGVGELEIQALEDEQPSFQGGTIDLVRATDMQAQLTKKKARATKKSEVNSRT
jgi:hypothetical protein